MVYDTKAKGNCIFVISRFILINHFRTSKDKQRQW